LEIGSVVGKSERKKCFKKGKQYFLCGESNEN